MKKKIYQVIKDGQIIGTRKSDRVYTHANIITALPENYATDTKRWPAHMSAEAIEMYVAKEKAKLPRVLGYCGTHNLALSSPDASRFRKAGYTVEVVPVTVKA